MTVNLTLFAQLINFFVAYLLITRLLLKPFLHTKRNQEYNNNLLTERYNESFKQLSYAQAQKELEWNVASQHLAQLIPLLTCQRSFMAIAEPQKKSLYAEPTVLDQGAVKQIAQRLIQRILRP